MTTATITVFDPNTVAAVILAGGQSLRMGGVKKSGLKLGGQWLLELIIARVRPQSAQILLNLNEPIPGLPLGEYPVVADVLPGYPGPLTGLVSAVDYLANAPRPPEFLLMLPCDGPFVPVDLAETLLAALQTQHADVACARYGGEAQPTFSLWRYRCGATVRQMLVEQGQGGFKGLLRELKTVYVDWPEATVNPFFNINTPEDLKLAEYLMESPCH